MRKLAFALLALSALLMISGAALLFGRPTVAIPPPIVHEESTAYTSELVVTFDADPSPADPLALIGGSLLLGGLMISAAAFGRRLAQEASIAE